MNHVAHVMFSVLMFRDSFLMVLTFSVSVIILLLVVEFTAIWISGDYFSNCFLLLYGAAAAALII